MRTKVLLSTLVLFVLLASCNMPTGAAPVTQPPGNQPASIDPNAMATAVELTAIARVTEIAGSAVPATPTSTAIPTETLIPTTAVASGPCSPLVTATVNANVRSGPDTAYDIVGSLTLGQTATILGRNDAYTWWYIDYPGVAGNHAWIAGMVVTSSCVPAVVQVVAAPPLPTPTIVVADVPTIVESNGGQNNNNVLPLKPLKPLKPIQLLTTDLALVGMSVTPNPATQNVNVTVKITVENKGTANVDSFTVVWWAAGPTIGCEWPNTSLPAGTGIVLTCHYKYGGWNNAYAIKAMVDPEHAVNETNETNNIVQSTLKVKPAP